MLIEKLRLLGKATKRADPGLIDARLYLEEGEEKESISEDGSENNSGAVRVRAQETPWVAMMLKRSKHPMSLIHWR